jgi:hypothetical protein
LLHLEYAGQSAKGAVVKIMRILFVVGCLATEGILAGCVTGSDFHIPVAEIRFAHHAAAIHISNFLSADPTSALIRIRVSGSSLSETGAVDGDTSL